MGERRNRDDREEALAYVRRAVDAGQDIGTVARLGLQHANAQALRELAEVAEMASGKGAGR